MRWVVLTILAGLACFGQSSLQRAVEEGRDLNADQAAALEQQLAAAPAAVEARARLIGYYFRQVQKLRQDTPAAVRTARGRHIRWFIEVDPSSEVLHRSEAFAMSGWMHDSENLKAIADLWLAAVERAPGDVAVLRNATYLLQQYDRRMAAKLMGKAYELTSGNDFQLTDYYGLQLGLVWSASDSVSRKAIEAEIEAAADGRLMGAMGHTIVQYANPGSGETAEYARRLLEKAIALTPRDRIARAWEFDLERIRSGTPWGTLFVPAGQQLARLKHRVEPEAPASAAVEGVVLVKAAEIGPDGAVTATIAVSGPKELQPAAAAAVKQWRFEPTLVNGRPTTVQSTFEVRVGRPTRAPDQN